MAITVDIPGVGPIVVEGVASEATLQALVREIRKNTPRGNSNNNNNTNSNNNNNQSDSKGLLGSAKALAGTFGMVAGTAKRLADSLEVVVQKQARIANLTGAGITSATNEIFLFGDVLSTYVREIERNITAFQTATQAGATFGGNVLELSQAAGNAGLSLNELADIVKNNGDALRLLSGGTEEGARRFAELGRELRRSSTAQDLANLGFTTQDVNQGLANYIRVVNAVGVRQNRTNQEYVSGTVAYLKELDLLAKVTGETREEAQRRNEELAADAQFQAQLAQLESEGRTDAANNLRLFISSLPTQELRTGFKELLVSTTASGQASQDLVAFFGEAGPAAMEFGRILDQNGEFTLENANQLRNLIATNGDLGLAQFNQIGQMGALTSQINSLAAASRLQQDELLNNAKAQAEAAGTTEVLAEMNKRFIERINELSNLFSRLMVDTGLFENAIELFESTVGILTPLIQPIISVFNAIFALAKPIFDLAEVLSKLVGTILLPLSVALDSITYQFNSLINFFSKNEDAISSVNDTLFTFGKTLIDIVFGIGDVFHSVGDAMMDFANYLFGSEEDVQKSAERRRERDARRERDYAKAMGDLGAMIYGETSLRKESADSIKGLDYSSPEQLYKTFSEQQQGTGATTGLASGSGTSMPGKFKNLSRSDSVFSGGIFAKIGEAFDKIQMPTIFKSEYWEGVTTDLRGYGQDLRESLNEIEMPAIFSSEYWNGVTSDLREYGQDLRKMFSDTFDYIFSLLPSMPELPSLNSLTFGLLGESSNKSGFFSDIASYVNNIGGDDTVAETGTANTTASTDVASTTQSGTFMNQGDVNSSSLLAELVKQTTEQNRLLRQQISATQANSGDVYAGT